MCAHKQSDFLERAYGRDYMEVGATQDIDHIRGLPCTPVHFKLDKYLYEPAKPFVWYEKCIEWNLLRRTPLGTSKSLRLM